MDDKDIVNRRDWSYQQNHVWEVSPDEYLSSEAKTSINSTFFWLHPVFTKFFYEAITVTVMIMKTTKPLMLIRAV